MTLHLNKGDPAPFFEGFNTNGERISSQILLGSSYLIYFYPKDDTPGCTAQACSFRDSKSLFDLLRIRVIGVSPDSRSSHQKFISKYDLNFDLLNDETHQICEAFGVWQEKTYMGKTKMGVVRSTFLIDEKGLIQWIESPVKVEGQFERVLEALNQLKSHA